jgi:hypothetical protein
MGVGCLHGYGMMQALGVNSGPPFQASGLARWERIVEPIGPVPRPQPEGGQA